MRQSRLIRPVGILLVIVLSLFTLIVTPVSATSTDQALEDAKNKQAALEKEMAKLEKETAQLNKSLDNLSGELAWLNNRSAEQKQLYQEKTSQLQAAVQELVAAYAAYASAVQVLQDKQKQYVDRMQVMFDHRQRSIIEVFIEADSLQGFFTTLQFMNIVAETDQQMLDELEAAKDQAKLAEATAEQKAAELGEVVKQLEADLAKLKADAEATQADMNVIEERLSEQAKAEDALNEESAQLAVEVAALQIKLAAERAAKATAAAQATLAAQKKPTPAPSGGSSREGWVWPYPGDHTVYSPYGMRYHPVYHRMRFHSGVDLGGSYGAPVVAAHSGTILMVRNPWEGRNTGGTGYGNYIVIDHGDGYSTLYAHLKNTLVHAGQEINAGDKIATCGSTGTSTGPHLHFEVMIDGHTENPINFVR